MKFLKKPSKAFIFGAIFGLLAPIFGLFIGLQVSPALGSLMLFPFVLFSILLNEGFLNFPLFLKLFIGVLSVVLWGFIFVLISMGINRVKRC